MSSQGSGRMTSDDQQFLDFISAVPNHLRQYTVEINTYVDGFNRHIDGLGDNLRDTLSSATWLPDSIRPTPRPPVRRFAIPSMRSPHRGYLGALGDWIWDHQACTAAAVAFCGTASFMLYKQRQAYLSKRRAKRTRTGDRLEAVVVAGASDSPISRSIILDLERRGFLVYVIASSPADDEMIRNEGKEYIQPFSLNVTDSFDTHTAMSRFSNLLRTTKMGPRGCSYELTFAGLLVVPDVTYPSGPLELISPELWSDALNAKILSTVTTIQAFMTVLREFRPPLLILTPTIISSLRPPFHTVESAVVGALEGFTASLKGELASVGVDVYQIKFGNFDCSNVGDIQPLQRSIGAELMSWPSYARTAHARNFLSQQDGLGPPSLLTALKGRRRGTSLRKLNNAVFDTLAQRKVWRSTQRIGQGSILYPVVGALAPTRLITWMMGVKSGPSGDREERGSPISGDSAYWEKV